MKEETHSWLIQAEADLKTAKNSSKSKDYYAYVFWSQQATEKSLKAILIEMKRELIKIHDLVILGRMAEIPSSLLTDCEALSKIYIESRYGILDNEIPAEKFDQEDSLKFISIAENVIKWCRKRI